MSAPTTCPNCKSGERIHHYERGLPKPPVPMLVTRCGACGWKQETPVEEVRKSRLMEGVWDLRFTPEIPDDFAFGHGSGFWNDCYRQFVYSTDGYPDQAERVGPTDRIAIGVVHQDGDTVHGRDWDGRAVILKLRTEEAAR